MIFLRVTSIALLVLGVAACERPPQDAPNDADAWLTRELGWVEDADPAVWAVRDKQQQNQRFLSVCGIRCDIVGVGELAVRMCHPDVPVDIVDKTTEAVQSDAHAALKARARAFAESYNRLVASDMTTSGQSVCPPTMDWEAAYAELAKTVDESYPGRGFRGDVSVHYERSAFQIRLPRGVEADTLKSDLCAIVVRNGLGDRAVLEAKSVDRVEDYAPVTC